MTALVIAEHDNAKLKSGTSNAVTAAAKMGGEVHVLVAGQGCAAAAARGREARRRGQGAAWPMPRTTPARCPRTSPRW